MINTACSRARWDLSVRIVGDSIAVILVQVCALVRISRDVPGGSDDDVPYDPERSPSL